MNGRLNIVVVAGDPGGAEAVAPVLTTLQDRGVAVHAFPYLHAAPIWQARGLAIQHLDEGTHLAAASSILRNSSADLLLTATSVNGLNLERIFIAAARRARIPSLGVLDAWTNYRARFTNTRGDLEFVPDQIAVMDDLAKQDMVAAGFEAECVTITGQPAYDEIAEWKRTSPPQLRSEVRKALKIEDSLLVVFASQPLSRMPALIAGAPNDLGYDENSVLAELSGALEEIAARIKRSITLLVRPHPRETVSDFSHLQSESITILVSSAFHRREIALAADLVAGMNSAFLIESCHLGCPTISLQPGLRQRDSLPTNAAGFSRAVYHTGEMLPVLTELLLNPDSCETVLHCRKNFPTAGHATAKVVALLEQMAARTDRIHAH